MYGNALGSIGGLLGGLQQARLGELNQMGMAQSQMNMMQAQQVQINGLSNAATVWTVDYGCTVASSYSDLYEESRARSRLKYFVEEGERLYDRIAFWQSFGWLAMPLLRRLSNELEEACTRIEQWAPLAKPHRVQ